jgi:hypothetical protein
MTDTQQDPNKTENQAPNPTGADNAKAQAALDKQQADKAAAAQQAGAGAQKTPGELHASPADVVDTAEDMQQHIKVAQREFDELDTAVQSSPAADHGGIKGLLERMRTRLENLGKHAAHNVGVATVAADAPAAPIGGITAAAPVSTATSDAHLNRGNGGAVTGNRPTKSAPKVAVQ